MDYVYMDDGGLFLCKEPSLALADTASFKKNEHFL